MLENIPGEYWALLAKAWVRHKSHNTLRVEQDRVKDRAVIPQGSKGGCTGCPNSGISKFLLTPFCKMNSLLM